MNAAVRHVAVAGAAVLVLLIVANRRNDVAGWVFGDDLEPLPEDDTGVGAEQGQGDALGPAFALLDITTYIPAMTDETTAQANRSAILQTIRKAEGTSGPDGYRTMFGYRLFDSFADHPRQPAQFTDGAGRRLWTSAAGAYQFMAVSPIPGGSSSTRVDTWDRMQKKLDLPDFSPASQDAAALGLIAEAGAMNDVNAGRFDAAIDKIRRIWASLPGAGYAQPERSIESLRTAFVNAGGKLA